MDIRRRILKDFNKTEDDFPDLREYNDYLEEVETIIFNLANSIDVDETKRRIEQYKRDNKDQITRNRVRPSQEDLELEEILIHEKELHELRNQESIKEEKKEKLRKMREKEALIDDLMFSEGDAKQILAMHSIKPAAKEVQQRTETRKPATQFSTGIAIGHKGSFVPPPKVSEAPLYSYVPPKVIICGPDVPEPERLSSDGYLKHVRQGDDASVSSGFRTEYACYRALQEAFNGLFFFNRSDPSEMDTS